MKKSFKLLLLFFVFATTFLSGCSEEIYDDHLHEQKQNITTRRIKSDELFRDKKVVVELNNVKSFLSSENQLSNQRLVNINGYIIETDDVLLTEYAGIKSYTFPIYEINAEKLKNLVIAEKLDGTYVSKIFEYDLTPSEKIDLENDELKTIQNPVNVLRFSNETFGCGFETTIVYIPCSQGVHDSSNLNDWYRCEASVQPSIKVIERLVGCDDGGGGGALLNTTGSNPIDYTPVGGTSSLNNNFPNESTNPNDFENGITQPIFTSIDGISEEQLNINLFHNSLNSEQHVWVNENQNTYEQLIQHLIQNNFSTENQAFVINFINSQLLPNPDFTQNDYPGKNNNLPFNWWNDTNFIKNNLKIIPDGSSTNIPEEPNMLEIALFSQYPVQALLHISNSHEAISIATITNLPNRHNGKQDAFRHAYWNARDAADFGVHITNLFTTAHEWNSGNHPLETQMDFFNNSQGQNIGENYNILTSDSIIQTQVMNAVNYGTLKYLSPLGQNPIYPTEFDIILTNTQIKWTNQ